MSKARIGLSFILAVTLAFGVDRSSAAPMKNQSISTVLAPSGRYEIASGPLESGAISTSGLPVTLTSRSPATCTTQSNSTLITPVGLGYCRITFTQPGNKKFSAASSVFLSIVFISTDQLAFSLPTSVMLADRSTPLTATSSLGNLITFRSLTSSICRVDGLNLIFLTVGSCQVEATTPRTGSPYQVHAAVVTSTVQIRGTNAITFSLPSTLPIGGGAIALSGRASSGLQLTYISLTQDTCQVNGTMLTPLKTGACKVQATQGGNADYPAAYPVNAATSITVTRYTENPQDNDPGYKIQAIYVVPSDGVDHQLDTNGYIASLLKEGNAYLQQQIGLRFPLAQNPDGSISVLYLHSQYQTSYLNTKPDLIYFGSAEDVLGNLLSEIGQSRDDDVYGTTHYIFFTDVINFNNSACGYAPLPGNVAMVAVGGPVVNSGCNVAAHGNQLRWQVNTWIHETFHGLGIDHMPAGVCDLMLPGGSNCPNGYPIDSAHAYYVGSTNLSGIDILSLPVWEKP